MPPRIGVRDASGCAAAHSPKFQAVTVPTTAANWWLFRVACQLSALKATKSSNRNGLSPQGSSPPARLVARAFFRGLAALADVEPFGSLPLAWPDSGPSALLPPLAGDVGVSRTQTVQQSGTRKLSAPRIIVASCSCSGRFEKPDLWMKSGIGVNSPIVVEKIGLLIVRASSSG